MGSENIRNLGLFPGTQEYVDSVSAIDNIFKEWAATEKLKNIAEQLSQSDRKIDNEASKQQHVSQSSATRLSKKIVRKETKVSETIEVSSGTPDILFWDEVFDRTKVVYIAIFKKGSFGESAPLVLVNNFFITSITTIHNEQFQLIRGNEGFSIYPFGEQPQIISIGGVFDESFGNQMTRFFLHYVQLIRLKSAFNKYDVVIYQPPMFFLLGYFVSFQFDERAENLPAIPFGCSFLIKKRYVIGGIKSQGDVSDNRQQVVNAYTFDLSEFEGNKSINLGLIEQYLPKGNITIKNPDKVKIESIST